LFGSDLNHSSQVGTEAWRVSKLLGFRRN